MNNKPYPRLLWWLTIATFLVPLIVVPSHFIFPFIVPKVLVFRTLVLCQLGVFLVWWLSHRETVRLRRTPVTIAVLFFGVSFALSTFLGTDWYHSFWDNHERMLGLFTVAHYILYYFIITTVFTEAATWRRLLYYFVAAGSIVMLIGVWQKIQPDFLLNNNNGRTSATLGNAIYLGGYGVWIFFVSLFLAFTEKRWLGRGLFTASGILAVLAILASGTRGSVVGVGLGLAVMFTTYFFTLPKEYQRQRRMIGVGAAVAALGFLLLFAFRATPFVRSIPAVGGLLNTNFTASTASTRLMAWEIAWQAAKDYPLFGWGPNNFFYAFNKYYNPNFLSHGWGETWFDNAHNIVMNTLTTQGVVGLAAYLSLFAVAIWQLFRARKKNQLSVHLVALSSAWLAAHLVQNIFVFENITSYLFFFFYLAFINGVTRPAEELLETAKSKQFAYKGVMTGAVWIVLAMAIFITNINPGRANMAMIDILRAAYQGSDIEAVYNRVLTIGTPHRDDNRSDLVRIVLQVVPRYVQTGKRIEAQRLVDLGIAEMDKNRALHPYDIRNHIQEAQLLQVSFDNFKNVDHLLKSEKILEEALVFSPDRQQIHYMLSVTKNILGKHEESVAIMRKSVAATPAIPEGWWRLAYALQLGGKLEEAREVVREARTKGITFDGVGLSVVNQILPNTP